MSSKNPFNRNRAEQMGDETWKYYVKTSSSDLLSEKPLIFEGSRGCGKTMFFLCNSWREKFLELEADGCSLSQLFDTDSLVGFYYKVDGKFVGRNLSGKGVEDWVWQTVFNTYFNAVIAKEVFAFIDQCISQNLLIENDVQSLLTRTCQKLGLVDFVASVRSLSCALDRILDQIESFSNDPEQTRPVGLHAGTLIASIIEELRKVPAFRNARFHVFIDEFEELNIQQQRQLNTLLKQSNYWLVYDIGVKSKGRYTAETISGEIIQEPHDFVHYYPESDSFNRQKDYEELLIMICRKRLLDYVPSHLKLVEDFSDIAFYLKNYGKEVELDEFSASPKFARMKLELSKVIYQENSQSNSFSDLELNDVIEILVNKPPDIVRMHISLLKRKGKVTLSDLYQHALTDSMKYRDWKHNMLFATRFLLCKEFDMKKRYYGLNTFSMLSSGVIRSFLEICESAFDFAFSNGFSFENPRSLSLDEQTAAAHYVSQSKVAKIDGFVPDGVHLKRFVMALGKIFFIKHTDSNATLGEPEPNHFHSKVSEVKAASPDAFRILENAVMHNVLQLDVPTKEKTEYLETVDYHLNHIFCPFFRISHRRKRKVFIDPTDLRALLIGNIADVERTIRALASKSTEGTQTTINFLGDDLPGEV